MPSPCTVTPAATNPSTPTPQELVQIAKDVSFNTQRALALHMITEEEASALTSRCDARMAKDLSFKLMKSGDELLAAVKESLKVMTAGHPEMRPAMGQDRLEILTTSIKGYSLGERPAIVKQCIARMKCEVGSDFERALCKFPSVLD